MIRQNSNKMKQRVGRCFAECLESNPKGATATKRFFMQKRTKIKDVYNGIFRLNRRVFKAWSEMPPDPNSIFPRPC